MITKCNYVGSAGTFESKDGILYEKYLFEDRVNAKVVSIVSDNVGAKFDPEKPYYIETYKGANGWCSRLLNVL